jgi:N-acetylglutamate synthase-like GNAT family acetyltransferase
MRPSLIEICPFKPQYAEGVTAIVLSIQQMEFKIPISLEAQPDLMNIPGVYQRGAGNFWIALSGDEVVGTVGVLDIGNRQVAMRKMFVKSSFRSTEYRLGRQLLDTLFQWCRSQEVKEIYLGTAEKFVSGHRFYERNGFREIARSQLPSKFPVMSVDTKFYFYSLEI